MTALTLKAHFDGQQVRLDEPCDLRPGTPLMVTVLPKERDLESTLWAQAAAQALARAYGEDEPQYTLEDVKR